MSVPPDGTLLREFVRTGDESAFRTLYRRHERALFATLLRLAHGRREEAADLVQETWTTAIRRADTFRGEAAFLTWLLGIAVNKTRENRRARSRRRRRILYEGEAAAGLPEGEAPALEPPPPGASLDIERALAGLPARSREAIVLHDVRGHTHGEIAAILGITEGTSKSQLHYARTLLRKALAAYGPGTKGRDADES